MTAATPDTGVDLIAKIVSVAAAAGLTDFPAALVLEEGEDAVGGKVPDAGVTWVKFVSEVSDDYDMDGAVRAHTFQVKMRVDRRKDPKCKAARVSMRKLYDALHKFGPFTTPGGKEYIDILCRTFPLTLEDNYVVFDVAIIFDTPSSETTSVNMPVDVTLNGILGTLLALYKGKNANSLSWPATVGVDLSLAGSGAAPGLNQPTGLNNADDVQAVVFADPGKYYAAPNNTFLNDDGVGDYVTEVIFANGALTGTEDTVFGKYESGTGFLFYRRPDGIMGCLGLVGTTPIGAFAPGAYKHVLFISRRGGNVRGYVDGVLAVNGAIGGVGSAAAPFQFNAYGAAHSSQGMASVAWFAMWRATNLAAGTTAEMDALAALRAGLK